VRVDCSLSWTDRAKKQSSDLEDRMINTSMETSKRTEEARFGMHDYKELQARI
jgi:hypothetical protein